MRSPMSEVEVHRNSVGVHCAAEAHKRGAPCRGLLKVVLFSRSQLVQTQRLLSMCKSSPSGRLGA